MKIQRIPDRSRREPVWKLGLHHLPLGMNASVGPARRNRHRRRTSAQMRARLLNNLLHRNPVRLPLPSHEAATVILQFQRKPGQPSSVPGGIA